MRTYLLTGCLFLGTLSTTLAGGPWVPAPRKGYIQIGYSTLNYASVFSPKGDESPVFRDVSDVTLQAYLEYGLAKKWGFRAVLPYKSVSTGTSTDSRANPVPAGSVSGLGNIGFGLKRVLHDGGIKVSAGVDALANTFRSDDRLGLRTGFEGWTVLPYLSAGTGGQRTYVFAEVGYGFMTRGYSNFLKINAEFGYRVLPGLWVAATIDARQPARNGQFTNTTAYLLSSTYLNDQQFLGVGLKGSYDIVADRFGISASAIGALSGENVAFTPSLNVGVFFKW